jgi:hypothetical protein
MTLGEVNVINESSTIHHCTYQAQARSGANTFDDQRGAAQGLPLSDSPYLSGESASGELLVELRFSKGLQGSGCCLNLTYTSFHLLTLPPVHYLRIAFACMKGDRIQAWSWLNLSLPATCKVILPYDCTTLFALAWTFFMRSLSLSFPA